MKTTPIFAFLLGLLSVGCDGGGDKPPAYTKVSGTVTYNAKPLDNAKITFAVAGRPPVTLDVVDGKFSGQAMSGDNRVSVSARRKASAAKKSRVPPEAEKRAKMMAETMSGGRASSSDGEQDSEDYIPAEWGASGQQMRVVSAGQENTFQFDIRGK